MTTLVCGQSRNQNQKLSHIDSEKIHEKTDKNISSQAASSVIDELDANFTRYQLSPIIRRNSVQSSLVLPSFSDKPMAAKSSLEYTITTISYGIENSGSKASTMAEITVDDWDLVATVKVENGKPKVEFDDEFDPSAFNISENDFVETVKRAAKELGAEDI